MASKSLSSLLLIVAVLALTADASKLPPGITPCSRNDPELLNECAFRSAQAAIPFMAKGHPAFGLPPMDPLYVSEMRVDDSGTSYQITVNVLIRPFVITGLRDVKVKNFKIDLKTGEVTWSGFAPRLEMVGKYTGSGRIIFMPVRGSGSLNVTLINTEFTHTFRLIRAENRRSTKLRSVDFVTPRDSTIESAPGDVRIHLENLFNGDKRLVSCSFSNMLRFLFVSLACSICVVRAAGPSSRKLRIPSLNLAPLDPLQVKQIKIEQGQSRQFTIDLTLHDLEVTGLQDLKFKDLKIDPESGNFEVKGNAPLLTMLGTYDVRARLLLLPIVSDGGVNITLENVSFTFGLRLERKGKYAVPVDNKLDFMTSRPHIKLDRLINGNQAISDFVGEFFNQNWKEVVSDLGPPIAEALNLAATRAVTAVFTQVPYRDIFPA
ncbi:hypothetical protein B566_EDAN009326 [Ephemera danica]|nr:hypothetical protein B566_EDAN009326 [Ephemera danica]